MISLWFDIIQLTIQALIYTWVVHRAFQREKGEKGLFPFVLTLICTLAVLLLCISLSTALRAVILFVSITIVTALAYRVPPENAYYFLISGFYVYILTDLVLGTLLSAITGHPVQQLYLLHLPVRFAYAAVSTAIQVLGAWVVAKSWRRINWRMARRYWLMQDAVITANYALAAGLMAFAPYLLGVVNPWHLLLYVLVFTAGSIAMVQLIAMLSRLYIRAAFGRISEMTNRAVDNQILLLQSSREALAKRKHDLDNQLRGLYLLIQEGHYDEALSYINEVMAGLPKVYSQSYTGHTGIDSVISIEKAKADEGKIDFNISAKRLPILQITSLTLATILFNLLDNAFEAVAKLDEEKRKVTLDIFMKEDYLNIVVQNPHKNTLMPGAAGRPLTSKKQAEVHGWGLGIVSEACEEYTGALMLDYTEDSFIAHAMLKNRVENS